MISAETIGYNVVLEYAGSYLPDWSGSASLPSSPILNLDGSTNTELLVGGVNAAYTMHSFNVYISAQGLAADQDIIYTQFNGVKTGGTTYDGTVDYTLNDFTVDPPAMGGSNAGLNTWYNQDFSNAVPAFVVDQRVGATSTGAGNGTYGDYAAYTKYGEAASPFWTADKGFLIGTMTLHDLTNEVGGFSFTFSQSSGKFKVISANATGTGTAANCAWISTYAAKGDTVSFKPVPEPSTLALLGCGLFGLLAYAWRKRK